MEPDLRVYGLFSWWWHTRGTKHDDASAYVENGVVHVRVVRWLLWLFPYRRYLAAVLAHEWMHWHRRDDWHDDAEGDVMSRRVWGWRTDKTNALPLSRDWREEAWRHIEGRA